MHKLLTVYYLLIRTTLAYRRLQVEINKLKRSKDTELEKKDAKENCCSETDTEGSIHTSDDHINSCGSPETLAAFEDVNDDVPLISLLKSSRSSPKTKPTFKGKEKSPYCYIEVLSPRGSTKLTSNQDIVTCRKRVRVVLSDDEDEMCAEVHHSKSRTRNHPVEDVATSDESRF